LGRESTIDGGRPRGPKPRRPLLCDCLKHPCAFPLLSVQLATLCQRSPVAFLGGRRRRGAGKRAARFVLLRLGNEKSRALIFKARLSGHERPWWITPIAGRTPARSAGDSVLTHLLGVCSASSISFLRELNLSPFCGSAASMLTTGGAVTGARRAPPPISMIY
jgi:hypothetical protein